MRTQNTSKALVLTFAMLLLNACAPAGQSNSGGAAVTGSGTPNTTSTVAPKVDGTWVGTDSSTHEKETLTLTAGSFSEVTTQYTDSTGTTPSVNIRLVGSYVVGKVLTSPVNADEFNITLQSYFVTPLSDSIASQMNMVAICGITNWAKNVEREVTGKTYMGAALTAGKVLYSIVKLDGTTLEIGKNSGANDGSTVAKRHTDLDANLLLTHH